MRGKFCASVVHCIQTERKTWVTICQSALLLFKLAIHMLYIDMRKKADITN